MLFRKTYIWLIPFLLLLPSLLSAQNSLHVYSDEIPWLNEEVSREDGKMYSIIEALQNASPGDSIIIHKGIYRETVSVGKDNIILQNYEDDYVLVSGANSVSGWTLASGMTEGVMVTDISGLDIKTAYTQLFANGVSQMMARHPNNNTGEMMEPMNPKSGYALLSNVYKDAGEGASGHATLTGTTLPAVDLNGGIFRGMTGKMRNYVYGNITASSGNSVTFSAINNGVWKNAGAISNSQHKWSWGFVMHKNLIDLPGEWYIENDSLFFLPEEGMDMDSTRIEIQVRERVLVLNNTSGVKINGINFIAGNVDMQNTVGATIESSSLRYLHPFWTPKGYGQGDSDPKGIYLSNSSDNTFKDNYLAHSWGNMIALRDGQNNSFENCVIKDFGWVGIFTSGIHINKSDNTNINNCTFGDAGRFQIRIDGGDAMVNIMDCDFYASMKMGEDAGPIEATSTGRIGALDMKGSVIAYNKIHDVKGVPVSDGNYKRVKATAFYMEDTENYTAHHNLIYNIKHQGYEGPHEIEKVGEFLYLGPRYNPMYEPVNYYNNTIWNVDENIGIWNIRIDNWRELGLTEPDTSGFMKDGHFANNIFMNGPGYKLSYSSQVITSTGAKVDWADSPPGSSIQTDDFNVYTTHCANWGYHFNPDSNQFFDFADAGNNFVDAASGDFNLKEGSTAIGAGTILEGITSSEMPDCGALEGGNRVLNAGADLVIPDFKEEGTNFIPETEWVKFIDFQSAYPDTTTVFEFKVRYNVFGQRDILVAMYSPLPEEKFIHNSRVTVDEGSDTALIILSLNAPLPAAEDYEIFAAVRPVGGNWQTNIVTQTLYADIIAPLPESVQFIDLITEIEFGTDTAAVNIGYKVNEQREVHLLFLDSANAVIYSDSIMVLADSGSVSFKLPLADTLTRADNYKLQLKLRNIEGSEVLASDSSMISLLADPTLNSAKIKALELKVYPNPARDFLYVQSTGNYSGFLQMEIYSIAGILYYSTEFLLNKSTLKIDISDLPTGAYILKLKDLQSITFYKN